MAIFTKLKRTRQTSGVRHDRLLRIWKCIWTPRVSLCPCMLLTSLQNKYYNKARKRNFEPRVHLQNFLYSSKIKKCSNKFEICKESRDKERLYQRLECICRVQSRNVATLQKMLWIWYEVFKIKPFHQRY